MSDITLFRHEPCGWRTWAVEGDPPPRHFCPLEDGRGIMIERTVVSDPTCAVHFVPFAILESDHSHYQMRRHFTHADEWKEASR